MLKISNIVHMDKNNKFAIIESSTQEELKDAIKELESLDNEVVSVITGKPYNGGILGIMANQFKLEQNETYEVTIKRKKL
jgi:hypothetical protein